MRLGLKRTTLQSKLKHLGNQSAVSAGGAVVLRAPGSAVAVGWFVLVGLLYVVLKMAEKFFHCGLGKKELADRRAAARLESAREWM